MIKHVVSVSGGKDSTATLLIALENCNKENIIPIFCDTGNEHEEVYSYLDYLEFRLNIKIVRLKGDFSKEIARKRMFIARDQRTGRKNGRRLRWTNKAKRRALSVLYPSGNPFLDLCMWKGRFPSRKAQFCTEELKRNLAVEFQLDLIDQGHSVLSWQGVRRDESLARRNAKKIERIGPKLWTFRPIVEWTAMDVFNFASQRAVSHNPLYRQGMGRVGCMPCINARKNEILEISKRFTNHIEKIEGWERKVAMASKRGISTFFAAPNMTNREASKQTVWTVVEWAKTTHGGKQFDLLGDLGDSVACSSAYGLCDQA